MTKRFTTVATSLAVAGLMSFSAQAGDNPSTTQDWANQAGESISDVMRFPATSISRGNEGSASFVVTVNREGDVVDYYATGTEGGNQFKRASERSLSKVDFPALPVTIRGEQLSFTLNMEYQIHDGSSTKAKTSKGAVTGTRLALLPNVSLSSGR